MNGLALRTLTVDGVGFSCVVEDCVNLPHVYMCFFESKHAHPGIPCHLHLHMQLLEYLALMDRTVFGTCRLGHLLLPVLTELSLATLNEKFTASELDFRCQEYLTEIKLQRFLRKHSSPP